MSSNLFQKNMSTGILDTYVLVSQYDKELRQFEEEANRSDTLTNEALRSHNPTMSAAAILQTKRDASGNRRLFQTLPRHLRRRAMSYNLRKMPVRLRQLAEREDGYKAAENRVQKNHRPHRRRPAYLRVKYERRQQLKQWLETHMWHAKRMHMRDTWGYRLAWQRCDQGARAMMTAHAHQATLHDRSYVVPIEISGKRDVIVNAMARCTDERAGATFGAVGVLDGSRAARNVPLYRPDEAPLGFVCTCSLGVWNVAVSQEESVASGLSELVAAAATSQAHASLFVFVHAAALDAVLEILEALANIYEIQVTNRQHELNLFEIRGDRAQEILNAALSVVRASRDELDADAPLAVQQRAWTECIEHTRTPASLPLNMLVSARIEDPRIAWPPRRLRRDEYESGQERVASSTALLDVEATAALAVSSVWNASVRDRWHRDMDSVAAIDRVRSVHTDDTGEKLNAVQPSIVLAQVRGAVDSRQSASSFGAGWDLIVPRGFGVPLWRSLVFAGARAVGVAERRVLCNESHQSEFPFDAIDSPAYATYRLDDAKARGEEYAARPPSKRVRHELCGHLFPFGGAWNWILYDERLPSGGELLEKANNSVPEEKSAKKGRKRNGKRGAKAVGKQLAVARQYVPNLEQRARFFVERRLNMLNTLVSDPKRVVELLGDECAHALVTCSLRMVGKGRVEEHALLRALHDDDIRWLCDAKHKASSFPVVSLPRQSAKSPWYSAASAARRVIGQCTNAASSSFSLRSGRGAGIAHFSVRAYCEWREHASGVDEQVEKSAARTCVLVQNPGQTVARLATFTLL